MIKKISLTIILWCFLTSVLNAENHSIKFEFKKSDWTLVPIQRAAILDFDKAETLKRYLKEEASGYKGYEFRKINGTALLAITPRGQLAKLKEPELCFVFGVYYAISTEGIERAFQIWQSCVIKPTEKFALDSSSLQQTINQVIDKSELGYDFKVSPRLYRHKDGGPKKLEYKISKSATKIICPLYKHINTGVAWIS